MAVARRGKEKKAGGQFAICIGSGGEFSTHRPDGIDLVPDSFQHEAFCSLYKATTRANLLIRPVGATFRDNELHRLTEIGHHSTLTGTQ